MILRRSFWTRVAMGGARLGLGCALTAIVSGATAVVIDGFAFKPLVLSELGIATVVAVGNLMLIRHFGPDRQKHLAEPAGGSGWIEVVEPDRPTWP